MSGVSISVRSQFTFNPANWVRNFGKGKKIALDESAKLVLEKQREYPRTPPAEYEWTFVLFRSWRIIPKGDTRIVFSDATGPFGPNWHYSDDVLGPGQKARFRARWPRRTSQADKNFGKDITDIFQKRIRVD